MARIVQVGGGIVGLCNAMLLANDGHEVTVLERDGSPPPSPEEAWDDWQRTGVNQFRLLHYLLPGFARIIDAELPAVRDALAAAGGLKANVFADAPAEVTGGFRPEDVRFDAITARRPVAEAAVSGVAMATDGLTIRRGVAVAGLVADDAASNGTPHVVGVRTDDGEEIRGDIVIDACGRRSPLPSWLDDIGARPIVEEKEDCGFVYYGRHFRSSDGSIPFAFSGPLYHFGTASILTLGADNGTWGVGLITSAEDAALRGLKDVEKWTAVVKSLPLHAHWLDGEPLDESVAVMAKIEDRHRSLLRDGQPVATGVLPVGDAWGATNPSVGRGITIGAIHARALRDYLRDAPLDDPVSVVKGWDVATSTSAEPWYRATLSFDHHRLGEIHAELEGTTYAPDDIAYEIGKHMERAAGKDPDCMRAFVRVANALDTPEVVLSDAALAEKIMTLGADWRETEYAAPPRDGLVQLAAR